MTVTIFPQPAGMLIGEFDVTVSETHKSEVELTSNPVERGVRVTDHVLPKPRVFECEVVVSNTPTRTTAQGEGFLQPLALRIPPLLPNGSPNFPPPPPRSALTFQVPTPGDRIKRMLDYLEGLQRNAVPVDLSTARRTYEDMILTVVDQTVEHVQGQTFHLMFEQLVIVSAETVNAPKPKEPRGQGTQAMGSQSTSKTGMASNVDTIMNGDPNGPKGTLAWRAANDPATQSAFKNLFGSFGAAMGL